MTNEYAPPGPGQWNLDRSHYANGGTPISQSLTVTGSEGFAKVFAEVGVPAERIDFSWVNGFNYSRLRPLVGADNPTAKPPPKAVLWLATRLHPEFRRRARTARRMIEERPSNAVVEQWEHELRPTLQATNRRFQDVDVSSVDDDTLQRHIADLITHLRETFQLHFWLHGHDLGPIAIYLHDAIEWGVDAEIAIQALAGASPSTAVPAHRLHRLRTLIDQAGTAPQSLDDVRDVGDDATRLLDEHLAERGHVLIGGYDLTGPTLIELPDVLLDTIRTAAAPPVHDHNAIAERVREQVPAEHRAMFDQRLSDARNVMDMRDDNGPLTIQWPVGLLRHALLEAGTRLARRDLVADRTHLLHVTPEEATALFDGGLPASAELAQRAAQHQARASATPPTTLGDPEPEPPIDVLPSALATLISATQTAMKYLGMDGSTAPDGLTGAGIGSTTHIGRACVASSAEDAIDRLCPGDVLVVRATTPAFNAVLAIAGAVVTTDGGPLSHAAVLARELGIPAVVGASGALSIPDGATVRVDAETGSVAVVA